MDQQAEYDAEVRAHRAWHDRRYDAISKAISQVQAGVNLTARRQSAKRMGLADIAIKAGIVGMIAIHRRAAPDQIAAKLYDGQALERVRSFMGNAREFMAISKAASPPMMTGDSGMAAIMDTGHGGLLASLAPQSIYARLRALGMRLSLEGYKSIALPYRASGAPAGSVFVGEGAPIPVRGATLAAASLVPRKAALISHYSAELFQHSTPTIESVVGTILGEDLAVGIDSVLLGNGAGSAIQPAGLLNGVTPITGSDSPGDDLGALLALFDPPPAQPVLIMGIAAATALGLKTSQPLAIPIMISDAIAPDTVLAVDAADFASATGDDVELSATEDAVLHGADPASPISAGTSGAGADTAAPVVSAWQQNLLALRAIEFISWAMRRPGRVQALEGVDW